MNIRSMEYFEAIAEEQSLSAAAKRLHVSQPTLSDYLIHLEEDLKTELFTRDKKKLILTEAGRVYYNAAKRIIAIRHQTYLSIRQRKNREEKRIIISGTPNRGALLFSDIYMDFLKKYPNTHLSLKESYANEIGRQIVNDEADIGVLGFSRNRLSNVTYIPTANEELVLAVPSFYEVKAIPSPEPNRLPSVSLSGFADIPFVMIGKQTNARAIIDDVLEENNLSPTIVYEDANNLLIRNMILQGAGVGFLPKSVAMVEKRIRCFSVTPRCYFQLGVMVKNGREKEEEIRYLAWLAIRNNRTNPAYEDPDDPLYKELCEEYENAGALL